MQFRAMGTFDAADIMARGHGVGAQFAGGVEQIGELHFLVALDAGHGRFAPGIGVGEILDHRLLEARFVIQHVMGDAQTRRHALGVLNVLPGAARAFAGRRSGRIKLQGDADGFMPGARDQRGGNRRVDAARHSYNDALFGGHAGLIRRARP